MDFWVDEFTQPFKKIKYLKSLQAALLSDLLGQSQLKKVDCDDRLGAQVSIQPSSHRIYLT